MYKQLKNNVPILACSGDLYADKIHTVCRVQVSFLIDVSIFVSNEGKLDGVFWHDKHDALLNSGTAIGQGWKFTYSRLIAILLQI